MKTSLRFFCVVFTLTVVFGISSCTKTDSDEGTGTFEFSMNIPSGSEMTKSGDADSVKAPYHLMISVADISGKEVITDKLVPMYPFGPSFISGKVEMKNGEYRLIKFMVINAEGKVLFATPVSGSPNAFLVTRPLPMPFNIVPDKVTTLVPEVLAVGEQSPSAFGYVAFGVQIVKPLDFWVIAVAGFNNPQIMAPVRVLEGMLTVSDNKGWMYKYKLAAAPNHIVIRGGSETYTLILEAESYAPKKFQFTAAQLMAATKEHPLSLNILQDNVTGVMSFQPGPDKGKDAMISNLEPDKNFGAHKYFEATFLSEPQLTVMRSNRSLLFFDMAGLPEGSRITKAVIRLVYEKPIPFDEKEYPTVQPSAGITWYGAVLQQIIEPWEENAVTWNKQPKTMDANQVFIPPFIRNTNIFELDVTRLLVSTFEKPAPNHGMLFRLWPEDRFPGFRFASSDYPEPSWRPKLTVQYTK